MWIILRILLVVAAVVGRQLIKTRKGQQMGTIAGDVPYFVLAVVRSRHRFSRRYRRRSLFSFGGDSGETVRLGVDDDHRARNPHRTEVSVPFQTRVQFRLTRETAFDKAMKSIGLSDEMATKDSNFDDAVYVASDDIEFGRVLRASPELRREVISVLDGPYAKEISAEGGRLIFRGRNGALDGDDERQQMERLYRLFSPLLSQNARSAVDEMRSPIVWRSLLAESIVWGIATYSVVYLFEQLARPEPLYLDWGPLFVPLLVAGALTIALFGGISIGILRASSWAPKVLLECALVLVTSSPFNAFAAVDIVNRQFDRSKSAIVTARIERVEERVTRSRSSRGHRQKRTSYLLHLTAGSTAMLGEEETKTEIHLKDPFPVSQQLFRQASVGTTLVVRTKAGVLGARWIQNISLESESP